MFTIERSMLSSEGSPNSKIDKAVDNLWKIFTAKLTLSKLPDIMKEWFLNFKMVT